ncbi:Irc21 protein [Martiniozyma asiatica (nom. inval.)]|nr:Irc21 protein [Martiniozyma asiatica]
MLFKVPDITTTTPTGETIPPVIDLNKGSAATQARRKVACRPNKSPLNWESHKRSTNQRPVPIPIHITLDELAKHKNPGDYWIALGRKIYNITDYIDYHPGGAKILLAYCGKDATDAFMKYHRWVNADRMLDACFLGFLVG